MMHIGSTKPSHYAQISIRIAFTYHTMDLTLLPPSSLLNAASGVSELVGHLPMPSTRLTRANAVVDRQELLKEAHESDEVTKRIMVLQIPTIE